MKRPLTAIQVKFLDLLFEDAYIGNPKQAMIDAGYSENSNVFTVMETIKEEIVERAERFLAFHAPEAIAGISKVQRDPDQKGAKARLEAAWGVLDRIGLTKKERIDVEVKGPIGIIILPAKKDNAV